MRNSMNIGAALGLAKWAKVPVTPTVFSAVIAQVITPFRRLFTEQCFTSNVHSVVVTLCASTSHDDMVRGLR